MTCHLRGPTADARAGEGRRMCKAHGPTLDTPAAEHPVMDDNADYFDFPRAKVAVAAAARDLSMPTLFDTLPEVAAA